MGCAIGRLPNAIEPGDQRLRFCFRQELAVLHPPEPIPTWRILNEQDDQQRRPYQCERQGQSYGLRRCRGVAARQERNRQDEERKSAAPQKKHGCLVAHVLIPWLHLSVLREL